MNKMSNTSECLHIKMEPIDGINFQSDQLPISIEEDVALLTIHIHLAAAESMFAKN